MKKCIQTALLLTVILVVGCSKETPVEPEVSAMIIDTMLQDGSDSWWLNSKAAMGYLNDVRENPSQFSAVIGLDLRDVSAMPRLVWSDTLYKIARRKVIDMAKRQYFAHRNPEGLGIDQEIVKSGFELDTENYLISPSTSNYESLAMRSGSENALTSNPMRDLIYDLIYDGGVGGVDGHRKHLLGIGDRRTLNTIGIGMVRVSIPSKGEGRQYMCVIITKKKK